MASIELLVEEVVTRSARELLSIARILLMYRRLLPRQSQKVVYLMTPHQLVMAVSSLAPSGAK
jgi:hypothetical protein